MSRNKVIYEINQNRYLLAKVRFPWLTDIPNSWPLIIQNLENYRPRLRFSFIKRQKPPQGSFKCNTDAYSRGNPGPSSIAFCLRDSNGDLIYARAR